MILYTDFIYFGELAPGNNQKATTVSADIKTVQKHCSNDRKQEVQLLRWIYYEELGSVTHSFHDLMCILRKDLNTVG